MEGRYSTSVTETGCGGVGDNPRPDPGVTLGVCLVRWTSRCGQQTGDLFPRPPSPDSEYETQALDSKYKLVVIQGRLLVSTSPLFVDIPKSSSGSVLPRRAKTHYIRCDPGFARNKVVYDPSHTDCLPSWVFTS